VRQAHPRERLECRPPKVRSHIPEYRVGTNWYAPSFSPVTGLFYLTAWEDYPGVYYSWDQQYEAGKWFAGGSVRASLPSIVRQEIRTLGPESGYGAIRALDPATGRRVWEYRMNDVSDSGLAHHFHRTPDVRQSRGPLFRPECERTENCCGTSIWAARLLHRRLPGRWTGSSMSRSRAGMPCSHSACPTV
jgi:hypothetical protein